MVILCTPIAPARTGNGLAMRAGVLLESLAAAGPVDLVVVPVSGPAAPLDWARAIARTVQVVAPVDGADPAAVQAHIDGQLGDPWLRERLAATAPLPAAARAAPATLADGVVVPDGGVATVVGLRVHLAPFTVALARRVAARAVVDADDDDVALLRALGDTEEADAVERLARAWLPECDAVWAASAADAAGLRARYDVEVRTVPNAVRMPALPVRTPASAPPMLLYVGNLTYAPNVDAARVLAAEVLPRVRAVRPEVTLTLVGPHAPGALDDLAADAAVTVTGAVPDVAPHYAAATAVVVPLRHGAGTRIKVLEAMAHGRPIVASSVATAGLDLEGAFVTADGADATATAVLALLDDPDRAAALAARGRSVVTRYSTARVGGLVRAACDGVAVPEPLVRRVLWHPVEIEAPEEVRAALDAVLPTAVHDFPAGETFRYSVEAEPGGFRVVEGADVIARVPDVAGARDVVHARFHRRVFERASLAGWLRVHGALVDIGGRRVLCTGPEGAGKSTLALRMLLDGLDVQGDESVVLRGRDALAVARPLHCKAGAEAVVPELDRLAADLPAVEGIRVVDPGRLGFPWRITPGPIDDVVVLGPAPDPGPGPDDGPVRCVAARHTEVLPDLVEALFPVTESKPALLGALTRALAGVGCHRLGRAAPAAMVEALRELG